MQVTNFRAAALARLGIAPEQLRARHPALVIGIISGYGRYGPEKDTAGYEVRVCL